MPKPYRTPTGIPPAATLPPPTTVDWPRMGLNRVPAAPVDVQAMAPAAVPAIARINTALAQGAVDVAATALAVGQVKEWYWQYLFDGQPTRLGFNLSTPLSDVMTQFFMSVVARLAYVTNDDATNFLSFMLPDNTTVTRYAPTGDPRATYDVWDLDGRHAIVAFPGTSELLVWLSYAFPGVVPATYLPAGWKMWSGLKVQVDRWLADVTTRLAPFSGKANSLVFVGHSAGGVLAQVIAYALNAAFQQSTGNLISLCVPAVYTYGCPAYLMLPDPVPQTEIWSNHVRVHAPGDPIPIATQVYLAQRAGLMPELGRFFPLFRDPGATTRHVDGVHESTTSVQPQRGQWFNMRDQVVKALLTSSDALNGLLASGHSIVRYSEALDLKTGLRADTSWRVWQSTHLARLALDKAGQ